jgi:hypothetical protein
VTRERGERRFLPGLKSGVSHAAILMNVRLISRDVLQAACPFVRE